VRTSDCSIVLSLLHSVLQHLGEVPEIERILATGVRQLGAVRRESQRQHRRLVALEQSQLLAARNVPKDDGFIFSARGEDATIRRKGDSFYTLFKRCNLAPRLVRGHVPENKLRLLDHDLFYTFTTLSDGFPACGQVFPIR
jgi:hypothetical protein